MVSSLRKYRSAPGRGVADSGVLELTLSREQINERQQSRARAIIHRAFNEGKNVFDLSSLHLVALPEDIADLKHVLVTKKQSSSGCMFASTGVHLYLSNNRIVRLPPCLYQMTNITVLSLRGNNLRELSPEIAGMRNLTELSVSTNQLKFLPAEVKQLTKLHTLSAKPNPFVEGSMVDVDYTPYKSQTKLSELSLQVLANAPRQTQRRANKDIERQLSDMHPCTGCQKLYHERMIAVVLMETVCNRVVPLRYRMCSPSCVTRLVDENSTNKSPGA